MKKLILMMLTLAAITTTAGAAPRVSGLNVVNSDGLTIGPLVSVAAGELVYVPSDITSSTFVRLVSTEEGMWFIPPSAMGCTDMACGTCPLLIPNAPGWAAFRSLTVHQGVIYQPLENANIHAYSSVRHDDNTCEVVFDGANPVYGWSYLSWRTWGSSSLLQITPVLSFVRN